MSAHCDKQDDASTYKPTSKEQTMKKIFALSIVAVVLAGCNTIAGVGKDVQKVGQVVEGAGKK
jgi:entericidin A